MMPRITAFTASDIMMWSILTGKAAFFSPIRPHAAIAKKRQNTIVSRVCLASVPIRLTRFEGSFSRRDFTLGISCTRSIIIRSVRIRASFAWRWANTASTCAWWKSGPGSGAKGFSLLNPAAATPVLMAEGFPPIPGAGDHRRISRRDARPGGGRAAAVAGLDGRARRGAPADGLVQRKVLRGGLEPAGDRAHLQALHERGEWRRRARRPT